MPIAIDEGVDEALHDYSHVLSLPFVYTPKVMWMVIFIRPERNNYNLKCVQ